MLPDLINIVETGVFAAPKLETQSRESWKRFDDYFEILIKRLEDEHGAKFRRTDDRLEIRLGIVRSTSTSGMRQLLNNWIVAARKYLRKREDMLGGEA